MVVFNLSACWGTPVEPKPLGQDSTLSWTRDSILSQFLEKTIRKSAQAQILHLTTCPVAEARRQKTLNLNVWIMANSHSQGGEYINHSKSIHLMNICGCYCSVTQSCPTLRDPTDCNTPGFLVIHYLPYFAQTHVHWVSNAIQPSHPQLPPSPPALNHSQYLQHAYKSQENPAGHLGYLAEQDRCGPYTHQADLSEQRHYSNNHANPCDFKPP